MIAGSTLVKDPEFWWNPAGIPARTFPEFQIDFGRNFAGNPPESTGISAGIPPVFPWNSRHFQPGFRQIIAGILPVLHWNSSRNYCRHSANIPLEFQLELLPAFHQNSAGIIAGILLVFWTTPAGIPLEFLTGIPLEFQNLDRILAQKSSRIIVSISLEILFLTSSPRIDSEFIHTNIHTYKLYLYTVN